MSNAPILPADLHRKVLLWLYDYAETPIMRLIAGRSMEQTVDWYNRIMTDVMDRWCDRVDSLMYTTDKRVSMKLINEGKAATFIYMPTELVIHEVPISQILEPVCGLSRYYRREQSVEMGKAIGLPKQLIGLLQQCDDTDNQMRLIITKDDQTYNWLQLVVDAAHVEQNLKREKKLIKIGIPLHKLRTPTLFSNLFKGLYLEFSNRLTLQLYSTEYNWKGDLVLVVYVSAIESEKQLRQDIEKLALPEPAPIEEPRKILRSKGQMKADRIGQLTLF